jgi:hypothetical protein
MSVSKMKLPDLGRNTGFSRSQSVDIGQLARAQQENVMPPHFVKPGNPTSLMMRGPGQNAAQLHAETGRRLPSAGAPPPQDANKHIMMITAGSVQDLMMEMRQIRAPLTPFDKNFLKHLEVSVALDNTAICWCCNTCFSCRLLSIHVAGVLEKCE